MKGYSVYPLIINIEDVLPYINNNPDFAIISKSGFNIIHYNTITNNPFHHDDPDVAAIYRELRGITFHDKTGEILRRPPHKFFNYNEPAGFHIHELPPKFSYREEEKMDGSMICPFIFDGRIIYATKRGETDISAFVSEFVDKNPTIEKNVRFDIEFGFSPTFEYMSSNNRVVLTYEESMKLLLRRHMITGVYEDFIDPSTYEEITPEQFDAKANEIDKLTGVEGSVFHFRFPDGTHDMCKVKTEWYRVRHRLSTGTVRERDLIKVLLEGEYDDLCPNLDDHQRKRADLIVDDFIEQYNRLCEENSPYLWDSFKTGQTRAEWGRNHSRNFMHLKSTVFTHFEALSQAEGVNETTVLLKELVRLQIIPQTQKGLKKWEATKLELGFAFGLNGLLYTSAAEETDDS